MLILWRLKAYIYDFMLNFNEKVFIFKTFTQGHHTQQHIALTISVIAACSFEIISLLPFKIVLL